MYIRKCILAAAFSSLLCCSAHAAKYTYVGSWAVADGPRWGGGDVAPGNTPPLSGQEAAAYLFGGSAEDYAISTLGSDPSTINFKSFLDGFADTEYLINPAPEDFVESSGPDYAYGYGNYSAYVFDHACGVYYCVAGGGEKAINYAFLISHVPLPASAPMFGSALLALVGLGFGIRRRSAREGASVSAS